MFISKKLKTKGYECKKLKIKNYTYYCYWDAFDASTGRMRCRMTLLPTLSDV
jgi:hypothetical protein